MTAKFNEPMVIIPSDSNNVFGRCAIIQSKKLFDSYNGKDVPAPFGGAWLLILGKDCEIDSIIEQL
jgi:hypothetical protein